MIVSFDPATNAAALASFQAKYGTNAVLLGPFSGKLDNSGESLELFKPDPPQHTGVDPGLVPYVLVERISYSDHRPWPAGADGDGQSLQRIDLAAYGNEPTNWIAAAPTAAGALDTDGDGLPDFWEIAHGFDRADPDDATLDADEDGVSNLAEFQSGTDPRDAQSYLKVEFISASGEVALIQFRAVAGKSYSLMGQSALGTNAWLNLTNVPPQATTQIITVADPEAGANGDRFYKLRTPAAP